jgi:hypothetical protein
MFNLGDYSKDTEHSELQDGFYDGKIEKVTVKKSQAGDDYLSLQLRLTNNRVAFDSVFTAPSNPKAAEIGLKKVRSIINAGLEESLPRPQSFSSIHELAQYLTGFPVSIDYKNKGVNEKGYAQHSIKYKKVSAPINPTVKKQNADRIPY